MHTERALSPKLRNPESLGTSRFFHLPGSSRPPCLPRRARNLQCATGQKLREWARQAFGADERTLIHVREFVSTDSRSVPHVVVLVAHLEGASRCALLSQASDQIVEEQIFAAVTATT